MLICEQEALMLLLQKDWDSLKAQVMIDIFSNKVALFGNEMFLCTLVVWTWCCCTHHRPQYMKTWLCYRLGNGKAHTTAFIASCLEPNSQPLPRLQGLNSISLNHLLEVRVSQPGKAQTFGAWWFSAVRGSPGHCRMFSLCLIDANIAPFTQDVTAKNASSLCEMC